MSKSIDIQVPQLKFPLTCVVCMSPASKQYEVQQVYSRGRGSATVKIDVPMCDLHFEAASFKSTAEKLVSTFGLIIGILLAIIAIIVLMMRWVSPEATHIVLRLLLGSIFGFGAFIMVWALFSFWLAPMFAEPESNEARNAIKITQVSPQGNILRLEFSNEQLAEIVQELNQLS